MKCPVCNTSTDTPFCPNCGTPLQGAACRRCNAELAAGARFCTRCGAPTQGRAATHFVPWLAAGVLMVALIVVLLVPALRSPAGAAADLAAAPTAPFADGGETGTPPPLTGTPREQADRLFNRIMQAESNGDSSQAKFFMPMAMTAYREADPQDADGLYHESIIETGAGDPTAGLATAQKILAKSPDHLLGLAAAAQAAQAAGDEATARKHWEHYLAVYDAQHNEQLQEYLDHAPILPEYERMARTYLGR